MNIPTARMEGKEKTNFEKWLSYLGVPIAAIVFALLFTMRTPTELTLQGKSAIAVFWQCLCCGYRKLFRRLFHPSLQ